MFTGIIEETGKILKLQQGAGSVNFSIGCSAILSDMKKGDSVSVNGVCQTVTEFTGASISFTSVEQTLNKTTLGTLQTGAYVNLERALTPVSRMGGHFVLGHVDTVATVKGLRKLQGSTLFTVAYPPEFDRFVVKSGSICIDGVSLTIGETEQYTLTVSVIPFTGAETTILKLKQGDKVNLEFDILAKYLLKSSESGVKTDSAISMEWLKGLGY